MGGHFRHVIRPFLRAHICFLSTQLCEHNILWAQIETKYCQHNFCEFKLNLSFVNTILWAQQFVGPNWNWDLSAWHFVSSSFVSPTFCELKLNSSFFNTTLWAHYFVSSNWNQVSSGWTDSWRKPSYLMSILSKRCFVKIYIKITALKIPLNVFSLRVK